MSRIHVEVYETSLGVQVRASMRVRRWKWTTPYWYEVIGATFPHGQDRKAASDAVLVLAMSVTTERLLPCHE